MFILFFVLIIIFFCGFIVIYCFCENRGVFELYFCLIVEVLLRKYYYMEDFFLGFGLKGRNWDLIILNFRGNGISVFYLN